MVFCGGVFRDGVEVVFRKKCVDFVNVVMCVYDYRCLAFVGSGNHSVIVGDFSG